MAYTGVSFRDPKYTDGPVEVAKLYNETDVDKFVFFDITASAERRETMLDIVSKIADEIFTPLTVGGGIRTCGNIKETFRAGADKVPINTVAFQNPGLIEGGTRSFGSQCVVISVDAHRRFDEAGGHYAEVGGESCWFECTIEDGRGGAGIDVAEWASEVGSRSAGELFINSADADGTEDGYDILLAKAVCDSVLTPVITSSDCGGPEDICKVFTEAGADTGLAASILHLDEYTTRDVKECLDERDVPVRL